MYMNYKRLFLNWIKQRDPRNIFDDCLRSNNQTLKNHVKSVSRFDNLIICNSFSWLDTRVGFSHWADLYTDWLEFYNEWVKSHYNNNSHVNYDRS